ncbi:MAG: efflux RND transporter periplasmic adaptor subunit [Rubrivivax sp.]|nr:efflux RND transporter periplasmic adaptor subunit [Rubrivivax sp.]
MASVIGVSACSRPEPTPEPVRAVRSMVVSAGQAGVAREYAAEIRARTESRLGFRVGGKLIERPVQLGDTVRQGQVLARLDPQDLRLVEQSAQAGVQAAEANAAQADADLKRFKGLFDQGFISAAELERRNTAATAARAQLAQARAQADVQGRQTQFGTLVADARGVITAVEAEPGAVVAAGTPIVRLAWDGPRDVVFAVPEDRAASLRALQGKAGALTVQLWGDGARPLRATIREIAAAADSATRTFQVRADLVVPSGAAPVKLGQTAAVTIDLPVAAAVIKLPITAVMQQQGQTAVWLLDAASMTVKVQPVVVAGADGNEVVVVSGLAPGQEVITAGVHVLTPGQKVKRFGAPAAAAAASGAPAGTAGAAAAAASR